MFRKIEEQIMGIEKRDSNESVFFGNSGDSSESGDSGQSGFLANLVILVNLKIELEF